MSAAVLTVRAPLAPLMDAPRPDAVQVSQALFGETVEALGKEGAWLFCRMRRDGYEGYLSAAALTEGSGGRATHTPAIPQTLLFPAPDIKAAPARPLYMGALLRVLGREGGFSRLAGGGFAITAHLRPLSGPAADAASVAEMFLRAPYLWGGGTSAGVDCSGLTQLALRMTGRRDVPRDSGDQAARVGRPLPPEAPRAGLLRRGDLVFWKGHVAMMVDETRIIHANGHHMQVAVEPLEQAAARISAAGGGPLTALRRP